MLACFWELASVHLSELEHGTCPGTGLILIVKPFLALHLCPRPRQHQLASSKRGRLRSRYPPSWVYDRASFCWIHRRPSWRMADILHRIVRSSDHPRCILDSRHSYSRYDHRSVGLWAFQRDAHHYDGRMLCERDGCFGVDGSAGSEIGYDIWCDVGAKPAWAGHVWL